MIVTKPVTPKPDEPCRAKYKDLSKDSRYPQPPASLLDGKETEWRLTAALRAAAQTHDPAQILTRSATAFFWASHPRGVFGRSSIEMANALADLSVTGRNAYARFRSKKPGEAELVKHVEQAVRLSPEATPANVHTAVRSALERAHRVEQAIHGPTAERGHARASLGWIAVSGEDDSPQRPVNVPSAPYPQHDLTVRCRGISVTTRYMIASSQTSAAADKGPVVPAKDKIIIFIHGHSSRLEESLDLVPWLLGLGAQQGQPFSVIAMDLPCCGYSSMFDHTALAPANASRWPFGFPILDFIEEFFIRFVETLDREVKITNRIAAIIGGSLGGNMGLRLGRHTDQHPWLRTIVAWSPASVWNSFHHDLIKDPIANTAKGRMKEREKKESRRNYFDLVFRQSFKPITPSQPEMWYRDGWKPCKQLHIESALWERREIYNQFFRRMHWRIAYEQLIFSHLDPATKNGPPRYESIRARTLLASGQKDNYSFSNIYDATRSMAEKMVHTPGQTLFLLETGHSIHNERPHLLSREIVNFSLEARGRKQPAPRRAAGARQQPVTVG